MPSQKNESSRPSSPPPLASVETPPAGDSAKTTGPRILFAKDENQNPQVEPSPAPPALDEIPNDVASACTEPPLRPRVGLANALRGQGLDEHKIAEVYAVAVGKLEKKDKEPALKLLLDVMKECTRALDLVRTRDRGGGDAPVLVQLIHKIPRPVREKQPEPPKAPDAKETSET